MDLKSGIKLVVKAAVIGGIVVGEQKLRDQKTAMVKETLEVADQGGRWLVNWIKNRTAKQKKSIW